MIAFLNPTVISTMDFVNITAFVPFKLNCLNPTVLSLENQIYCVLLTVKVNFPGSLVVPAMLYVSQVTMLAPLVLQDISLNQITCFECQGGLIQIMNVFNENPLLEIVTILDILCTTSISGYFGCLYITYSQIIQTSPDDEFLNITF
jgi:hypothetical protein